MGTGHIPSKPVALQEGPPTSRESGLSTKPRPYKIRLWGKALLFLFFTGTKSPGTTGNSVKQVTKRKLNTGKVKEDLNPFSSFFQIR